MELKKVEKKVENKVPLKVEGKKLSKEELEAAIGGGSFSIPGFNDWNGDGHYTFDEEYMFKWGYNRT